MATRNQFKSSSKERQYRYFSEDFKIKKVKEIERNITSVLEVSRAFEVTPTAIYKWIYKYSLMRKKGIRQVVESKSETKKLLLEKQKVRDLEQIVGQKQIEIDFLNKMIEIAGEELQVDIKKKFSTKPSSGSGSTGKSTVTK
jgi:transposase